MLYYLTRQLDNLICSSISRSFVLRFSTSACKMQHSYMHDGCSLNTLEVIPIFHVEENIKTKNYVLLKNKFLLFCKIGNKYFIRIYISAVVHNGVIWGEIRVQLRAI